MGNNSQKDGVNFGASSSAINQNNIGTSSGKKSSKRDKNDDNIVDLLVQAFNRGTEWLATLVDAKKKAAVAKTALPDDLFV
jgi:hypothetical protein